jgi:GTP-binding protein
MRVVSAEFIGGEKVLSKIPPVSIPEIAVIGRSNVGKSTLINRLCNKQKLARVSSTPGRTQAINVFKVVLLKGQKTEICYALTDLPGFGFAKFSKDERELLARLCVDYIQNRESLRVICLLNDCRRDPESDELAVQKLAFDSDIRLLVVVTKTDKLKQNELNKRLNKIAALYGLTVDDLLLTSQKSQLDNFWSRIKTII